MCILHPSYSDNDIATPRYLTHPIPRIARLAGAASPPYIFITIFKTMALASFPQGIGSLA